MPHTPETTPYPKRIASARTGRGGPLPAVLHVGASPEDGQRLTGIFQKAGWYLRSVPTISEALRHLRFAYSPVVISERDLPDGNWRSLLEDILSLPYPPYLIVSSRLADEHLWAEVLNLGGFDLLSTPFDRDEVQHVVGHACESWHRKRRQGDRPHARKRAASTGGEGVSLTQQG